MGINAVWRSERDEELGRVNDPQMLLSAVVNAKADLAGTTCLRFLDPYGDAVFNQLQPPVLVQELESLARATRDKHAREHLQAVTDLARRAVGEVHTYLWFIGD